MSSKDVWEIGKHQRGEKKTNTGWPNCFLTALNNLDHSTGSALFENEILVVNRHSLHEALHAVHYMVSIDFVGICYTREDVRFVKVQLLSMNFPWHGLSMTLVFIGLPSDLWHNLRLSSPRAVWHSGGMRQRSHQQDAIQIRQTGR